jgi:purine-binding chemotaxis protein CheW
MADGSQALLGEATVAFEGGAVVFALAGARYALPIAAVEAIAPPPLLSRVPHAPSSLVGAGNLGGNVVPILDLAEMLPKRRKRRRRYDGGGEILRLGMAGGSVGIWVDRVERLIQAGGVADGVVTPIDPGPLIAVGLSAPDLAAEILNPLGEAGDVVDVPAATTPETAYFLVETVGESIRLAQDAVLEFIEAPPLVPLPGAPAGFHGVAILRGDALPVLSLASLVDLPASVSPGSFALVTLAGHRLLLGFDRVIGLRHQTDESARENDRIFDVATAIPDILRRIVSSFAPSTVHVPADALIQDNAAQYLSFVVTNQNYALPVDAVDRVVAPQSLVALPRLPGASNGHGAVAGAIELRGQVVPVARLDSPANERSDGSGEPGAYVILRGAAGLMAIGAERVDRLVALLPEQIAPTPAGEQLIDGVAVFDGASDLLRILAPERLGVAG